MIITIIVLLVLAGVSIATLTGENGILKRASSASKSINEQQAKEKIEMEISNLIINKSKDLSKATIDDLMNYVSGNTDIQMKKESDTSAIIGTDGYAFKIDENLKIIETVDIALLSEEEITYIVNSTDGNTMNIVITANFSIGVHKIITPDGNEIIQGNTDKTKISLDYTVNSGEEYTFKILVSGAKEPKDYILRANIDEKPVIQQNSSYAYPLITMDGVKINKKVSIDYGDNTEKYYSIDNGVTWQEYTDELNISKSCTLIAKSKKEENVIQKIDKQQVEINLANDAVGVEAYDTDDESCISMHQNIEPGSDTRYMDIDKSLWGNKLRIKWWNWKYNGYYSTITFLDETGNALSTYTLPQNTTYDDEYDVPENAVKLKYWVKFANYTYQTGVGFGKLYEIQPSKAIPEIKISSDYTELTIDGAIERYATIDESSDADKTYYKIGDSDWIEYDGGQIKLNDAETIYAKGIWGENISSKIVSYTALAYSIGPEAYDGDDESCVSMHQKIEPGTNVRYMSIDESLWGKYIRIKWWNWNWSGYNSTITFLNKDGTTLASHTLPANTTYDDEYEVPENAVKLQYTVKFANGDVYQIGIGFGKLYEIQPVNK